MNANVMAHNTELVQTGLAVEQHNVAVNQMPLYDIADLKLLCNLHARVQNNIESDA